MLCLLTQSCLSLCNPMGCSLPGSSVHVESPSKNIRVDCHALFQEIFPTQGSNPGLPHCMWIVYRLNHQGSPRILEKVAFLFSRETLRPHISCLPYTSWRQLLAKKVFTHLSFIFLAKHFIPHPILVNAAPSPCLAHADSFNVSIPISTKIYGSLSDMRDRRKNKGSHHESVLFLTSALPYALISVSSSPAILPTHPTQPHDSCTPWVRS